MQVLVAPDKFKGTLTSAQVAHHVARGLAERGVDAVEIPVADGGDGSVDAALAAGFEPVRVSVAGPTGGRHDATFARDGGTAVVEVANTCGLALLRGRPAPLRASSHGMGDALRAALDTGATRVVLALGGSASTDAGAGLLQALGAVFRDAAGRPVERVDGGLLTAVATIDLTALPDLRGVDLVAATDVTNPLLGTTGAAAGYGAQKGADADDRARLEAGVTNMVARLDAAGRTDASALGERPGAGAAGGLGFAAMLLGARVVSGADHFLDLVRFDDELAGADVVVTGEGRLDEQTLRGKLASVIVRRAGGLPVVAVVGRCTLDAETTRRAGFAAVHALTDGADGADAHDPAGDPALTARLLHRLGATIALPVGGAP